MSTQNLVPTRMSSPALGSRTVGEVQAFRSVQRWQPAAPHRGEPCTPGRGCPETDCSPTRGVKLGTCQYQVGSGTEAALQNHLGLIIRPLDPTVLAVCIPVAPLQKGTWASPFSVPSTSGFPEDPCGLPKCEWSHLQPLCRSECGEESRV